MSKYDIFGGKPISAYHADGVSRRSTTTALTAGFVKAFRDPRASKEQAVSAFGPILAYIRGGAKSAQGEQQTELKSVVATLSNAWNKVVYNFFHAKQAKKVVMVGGVEKKMKVEVRKMHKNNSLNTVEYFRARHPKLFKSYLKSFKQFLSGTPSEGGVVVSNDTSSVGKKGLVNRQYGIVHYKKLGHYNDNQIYNIIRFLKDAHYDSMSHLADRATTGKLAQNRSNNVLYAKVAGTRYSVMTLYAMFRKLSKKSGKTTIENEVHSELSRLFAGVTPFAKTPIRGRDYSRENKDRIVEQDKQRHKQFKADLTSVGNNANLDGVAMRVAVLIDQVATSRARQRQNNKGASYERFMQIVDGMSDNTSYSQLKQSVKDDRSPEDSKFLNGYLLALRRRSPYSKEEFNQQNLGYFKRVGAESGRDNLTNNQLPRRNIDRRVKLAQRGVPRGGSLSSSRLSSMSSSSLSSRNASSFDDSEFTF